MSTSLSVINIYMYQMITLYTLNVCSIYYMSIIAQSLGVGGHVSSFIFETLAAWIVPGTQLTLKKKIHLMNKGNKQQKKKTKETRKILKSN